MFKQKNLKNKTKTRLKCLQKRSRCTYMLKGTFKPFEGFIFLDFGKLMRTVALCRKMHEQIFM